MGLLERIRRDLFTPPPSPLSVYGEGARCESADGTKVPASPAGSPSFGIGFRGGVRFGIFILILTVLTLPLAAQDNTVTLPEDLQPITPENVHRIQSLTVMEFAGRGFGRLVWSPDSQHFALTSQAELFLFFVDELNVPRRVPGLYTAGSGFTFAAEGQQMVVAGENEIQFIDINNGEVVRHIPTAYPVGRLLLNPDETVLAGMDNPIIPDSSEPSIGVIHLWDVETGERFGGVGYPYALLQAFDVPFAFHPQDETLLTGLIAVDVWDYRDPSGYRDPALISKDDYLRTLANYAYTPDSSPRYAWAAYRNEEGLFALWLTAPDGSAVFSVQDGTFRDVVEGESGEDHDENGLPVTINGYTQLSRRDLFPVLSQLEPLAFETPTGPVYLLSTREAATKLPLYLHDAMQDVITNQATGEVYQAVAHVGAGRYETVEGVPPLVERFYAIEEGRLPETLLDQIAVGEIVISPDGRLAAIAGQVADRRDETRVRILDLATGDVISQLRRTSVYPENLSFNADGSLIVGSDQDSRVHIWDAVAGVHLGEFEEDLVYNAAFSPDGRLLILYGYQIQVWGVPG